MRTSQLESDSTTTGECDTQATHGRDAGKQRSTTRAALELSDTQLDGTCTAAQLLRRGGRAGQRTVSQAAAR